MELASTVSSTGSSQDSPETSSQQHVRCSPARHSTNTLNPPCTKWPCSRGMSPRALWWLQTQTTAGNYRPPQSNGMASGAAVSCSCGKSPRTPTADHRLSSLGSLKHFSVERATGTMSSVTTPPMIRKEASLWDTPSKT